MLSDLFRKLKFLFYRCSLHHVQILSRKAISRSSAPDSDNQGCLTYAFSIIEEKEKANHEEEIENVAQTCIKLEDRRI